MMTKPKQKGPNRLNHGFTIIELIFSLVLLGILAVVFGMGITGALNVYTISEENVYIAQKGQMAMARIHRELMELTNIIARDDAAPHILYAHPRGSGVHALRYDQANKSVILYSDLPPATTALDAGSHAQFADVLADNVEAFNLSYWQGSIPWAGSNQRLLSHIQFDLSLPRTSGIVTNTEVFTGRVHLRNTLNYGGAAPSTEPPQPPSLGSYGCFIASAIPEDSPVAPFLTSIAAIILFFLLTGVGLVQNAPKTNHHENEYGKPMHGSVLISTIAAILILSTIAAALLPLVSSSGYQAVSQGHAAKAYLLAESGFRYCAGRYLNSGSDPAKLQTLDDLHKTFYSTPQGDFSVEIYSYFYRLSSATAIGANTISVTVPGDLPATIATAAKTDPGFFNTLKLRIGDGTYTISGFSFDALPATDAITFTVSSPISQNLAADTVVSPVADTPAQSLSNGGVLSYDSNDAILFPDLNGLVEVSGRNLNYQINNRSLNRLEGVRDLNDNSLIEVFSGDEILLHQHVHLKSTGYYGEGAFEVQRSISYDTPLYLTSEIKKENTFEDDFDDPQHDNWTDVLGSADKTADDGVLQVATVQSGSGAPRASLHVLKPSSAEADEYKLHAASNSSGNFLSYDAQIKVGFNTIPESSLPELPVNPNIEYYFAAGLSFRLDSINNNPSSYGISLMRGNLVTSEPPAYDNINNNIVPVENKLVIVLWRQTNNASDNTWLAYKEIEGWPLQDTTLVVRLKEATLLSFEDGTGASLQRGNLVIGQTSGARGRLIQGPILENETAWSDGVSGHLLLNMVSGNFTFAEEIKVPGRTASAIVRSYNAQKTNVIRVYYGTPDTNVCGTGNENPYDSQLLCHDREALPLQWPPDLKPDGELDWTAARDYFRMIQWDGINPSETDLDILTSLVEPDALLAHHHGELQTPSASFPSGRPELGLHTFGMGAANVYFDDFGLFVVSTISAIIPTPVQQ